MVATGLRPTFGKPLGPQQVPGPPQHTMAPLEPKASEPTATVPAADFTLQIAPMMVELAPQVVISTIGYNNKVPGPLLRMREGQGIIVDVVNDTDVPEYVHWHGLFVPSEMDGAAEEGTPPRPAPRPPALSIRGQAGRFAVVPLTHCSHDGSASGLLHRPVRISHDRFRE
jgi:FtsP/CotA-like multicopper oxidase with cupredoxin domain